MGRRIVEHHAGGLGQVLAKVIEKGDNIGRAHTLRGSVGVQLGSIRAQKAGHVYAAAAGGGQGAGRPRRLPGAGHVGDEGEAGFIVVKEVAILGISQLPQQVQVERGSGKLRWVSLVFERVAYALKAPPPGFLSAGAALLSSTRRHDESAGRPVRRSGSGGVLRPRLPGPGGLLRRVCVCGPGPAGGAG